jgi:hypothetical protein
MAAAPGGARKNSISLDRRAEPGQRGAQFLVSTEDRVSTCDRGVRRGDAGAPGATTAPAAPAGPPHASRRSEADPLQDDVGECWIPALSALTRSTVWPVPAVDPPPAAAIASSTVRNGRRCRGRRSPPSVTSCARKPLQAGVGKHVIEQDGKRFCADRAGLDMRPYITLPKAGELSAVMAGHSVRTASLPLMPGHPRLGPTPEERWMPRQARA